MGQIDVRDGDSRGQISGVTRRDLPQPGLCESNSEGWADAQTFSGSFYCLPETTGRISVTSVDGWLGGFMLGRCAIVLLGAGVPVASLARHTVLGLARTGVS